MSSPIEKVRIIVVGDSGVGKTSLIHLLANEEPLLSPGWTVGAQLEVKLHEYKEGNPAQNTFFIEFWDIGGTSHHLNARKVFYQPTNGVILVHDLTNIKSYENLQNWLLEILDKDTKDTKAVIWENIDPEQFIGSTQIPILIVGTKMDLLEAKDTKILQYKKLGTKNIGEWCNAEEINISCHNVRSLSSGTTDSIKFTRFFDKVIERKYYMSNKEANFLDKRRVYPNMSFSSTTPIKLFSPT
ncbi:rab-like protein 3 [Culicoides brevitarsis]|uniref:rab-like protein 3 n=1 Tax=Culicoides brevitarsis TaxID=469753 RepID=UPI00307B9E6C